MRWRPLSTAFSVSDMSGTAAWPLRSSGTQHRPSAPARAGADAADRPAVDADHVGAGRPAARPRAPASSSFWPLPATPAMPRISPRADLEARCPCRVDAERPVGRQVEVAHGRAAAAPPRAPARRESVRSSAPIISSAMLLRGLGLGIAGRRPPCRRAGSWRASQSALISSQLVADVEDRAALGGELAQRLEQPLDLLRRQHRGRLVHDQQLRVLQQAAHDLDALALADRERVDLARGVERQAVGVRDLDDPLRERAHVGRRRRRRARCSRAPSSPRTARSAGTPCRCRARARRAGRRRGPARPSQSISPSSACSTP